MNAPMLFPLIALLVGVIMAYYGAGVFVAAIIILLGCAVYALLLFYNKNPLKSFSLAKYHYIWIFLWFAGIGTIIGDIHRPFKANNDDFRLFKSAQGQIKEIINNTSGDRAIVNILSLVRIDGVRYECSNFKTIIYSDALSKDVDDIIDIPANFIVISDSENSFNTGYAEMQARKGIYYYQNVPDSLATYVDHKSTLHGRALRLRDNVVTLIENSGLNSSTSNFLITLLLGDREYLDSDTRHLFANAGVAHILALSGMHVAIVLGIFLFLLFPLNFFGLYRYRQLIAILLLWGYAVITGMAPSTIRACIMATALVITLFLERKGNALNSLLLAAFIIILCSPYTLFDIGMQLSFACVASLIAFVGPLNPIDQRKHHLLHKVIAVVLTTFSASFASWIIATYYFNQFPLMFLPANIIILPLLPIYVVVSLVYLLLDAVGLPIHFMAVLIDYGYELMKNYISWISGDSQSILTLHISPISICLWLVGCFFLAVALNCKRKIFWTSFSVILLTGSLISIPLLRYKEIKGYIICKSIPEIKLNYKSLGIETPIKFKDYTISSLNLYNQQIISVDCPINNKLESTLTNKYQHVDYLIVGGSYLGDMRTLVNIFYPQMIVIHPSVRKEKELSYIEECDSLRQAVYSLRRSGAIKVIASD